MSEPSALGVVDHDGEDRKIDYLYRISIKGLIRNEKGEVLVVKETGRTWWDLPGGGMDHLEDIKAAIARELNEEVSLQGNFTYKVIDVDDPSHLPNANVWQVRIIFEINPENMFFEPGDDGDEVAFILPSDFKHSENLIEQKIYEYASIVT